MSFDAGSILGHIGLETSEYSKGMLEVQGLNELLPESVATFLENPLLGFADMAKEVFAQVADFVKEAVSHVEEEGFKITMAAERAGASVEFMKKWETVGESIGVPLETLSAAFRGLQKSASDAVDQGGPTLKYWNEIGISTADLKSHLGDMPALFDMVREHLSQLPTQAERTAASLHLMRGGGAELNQIFNMTSEQIDALTQSAAGMGDTFTEQDAKVDKNVHELSDAFSHAWAGIEQATAKPILKFLSDHMDEILPIVKEGANVIETDVGKVMALLDSHGPQIMTFLEVATHLIEGTSDAVADLLQGITWVLDKASEFNKFISSIPGVGLVESGFGAVYDALGAGGGSVTNNYHMPLTVNPEDTAAAVSRQLVPMLKQQLNKHKKQAAASAHNKLVAANIGGNG